MALKELVETIAKALVDEPDQVEVRETEGDHHCLVELKVAKGDIGKVIGKDGKTASVERLVCCYISLKVICSSM